jgi:hypothetical protein
VVEAYEVAFLEADEAADEVALSEFRPLLVPNR